MKKSLLFFVDAETDGLYGSFLSVAVLVTDQDGHELEHFYAERVIRPDESLSPWVREHVLPFLGSAELTVQTEEALLEAFWAFWLRYRETAECVAYVQYPVEARLFTTCVLRAPREREFQGPFPLYDLSTLLAMNDLDVDCNLQALTGLELPSHHALNDVRVAAAAWKKLWDERKRRC